MFILFFVLYANLLCELSPIWYVGMGLSSFLMMRKLKLEKAWTAWVPFCNGYALGSIADRYNLLWRGKTTHHGKILLFVGILNSVSSGYYLLYLFSYSPEAPTTSWVMYVLWGLVAACHVYVYFVLYKIYKLFASDFASDLLAPSVLLTVTVPVISLILSFKKPCLPDEDSREPSELASKIIE